MGHPLAHFDHQQKATSILEDYEFLPPKGPSRKDLRLEPEGTVADFRCGDLATMDYRFPELSHAESQVPQGPERSLQKSITHTQ